MTPYFNSPERIESLARAAEHWRGTPWCANSEARGPRGGVSCHNLCRALYIATGAVPESFPRIVGYPNRHARTSTIEPFLNSRLEFVRLTFNLQPSTFNQLQPGDLLGFRLFHCLAHLGVVIDERTNFVHVMMDKLTTIDCLATDPTMSKRLLAVWRPVQ